MDNNKLLSGAAATVTTTALVSQPALAQVNSSDAVAEVSGIITALGVIAGAAIAVAVGPMAFSFGMRIFRRVMK